MFRILSSRRRRQRSRKNKAQDSSSLKTVISAQSQEREAAVEAAVIPSDASNVEDQSTVPGSETTATLTASQDEEKQSSPSDKPPDRQNRLDKNLGMVVVVEEDEEESDNFYDDDEDDDEFGLSSFHPTPPIVSLPKKSSSIPEVPTQPANVYSLISDLASLVTPVAIAAGLFTADSEDKEEARSSKDAKGGKDGSSDDASQQEAEGPMRERPGTPRSMRRGASALNRSQHDYDDETIPSLASDTKRPVRSILRSSSSYDGDESGSGREERRKFHQSGLSKSFLNTSTHSGATDEGMRLEQLTEAEDVEHDDDLDTNVSFSSSVVTFDAIQIREYGVTLGDHPDVTTGPPIALDWDYDESAPMTLDAYEGMKGPSRRTRDLRLPYYQRRNLLLETGQYSHSDLDSAAATVNKIKKQRKRTERLLAVAPLEEAVQSMRRVVSFRRRRSSKSKDTSDDRSVQSMPMATTTVRSADDDDDDEDVAVACTCGRDRSFETTNPKSKRRVARKRSSHRRAKRGQSKAK